MTSKISTSKLKHRTPSHAVSPSTVKIQEEVNQSGAHQKEHPFVTQSTFTISNNKDDRKKYQSQSFLLAKFFILRLLGFVYLIAFLSAFYQNRGLFGSHGLSPVNKYMDQLRAASVSKWDSFFSHPTLFWFMDGPILDEHLDMISATGIGISVLVIFGLDSWLAMFLLWLLDFSIVTVAEGSSFYSYGWESQLLETGFLAIFLCDLPHFRITSNNAKRSWILQGLWRDSTYPTYSPPSLATLWLFRWLCFRISIGAGLIKLRGASCWQDKTCLFYHFETQPIPSPLSFAFHFLPRSLLKMSVNLDFFVQLYAIWLVLVPGFTIKMIWLRRLGGLIQAGFMINIILSGNYAFLNYLTIIPAIACLDDCCWPSSLQFRINNKDSSSMAQSHKTKITSYKTAKLTEGLRAGIDLCLVLLIATLSLPVVTNLLQWGVGRVQQMNASFDTLRLVNTYGAFGSVGEARYEPIISISHDGHNWHEIDFPCKPGNITRRPCFCAPYHYRLDWNIWFLGFKPHMMYLQRREQWVLALLTKILEVDKTGNGMQLDRPWLALLDASAAKYLTKTPKYAKVDMYHYKMAAPLWSILKQGWLQIINKGIGAIEIVWWQREFEEVLIAPIFMHSETKSLVYASHL